MDRSGLDRQGHVVDRFEAAERARYAVESTEVLRQLRPGDRIAAAGRSAQVATAPAGDGAGARAARPRGETIADAPVDPLGGQQRDDNDGDAVNDALDARKDIPQLGVQGLGQRYQHGRADHGPPEHADAAEHRHDQGLRRDQRAEHGLRRNDEQDDGIKPARGRRHPGAHASGRAFSSATG